MQRFEQPSLPSGTPAGYGPRESTRWYDPLFGSNMSLVWLVVATGASIALFARIGKQQRERTPLK